MSVGTTRQLALGITTDDRRGAIRRRWGALATITVMGLVAGAGFLMAEKAYELISAKPAYGPSVESNPGLGRTLATPPAALAVIDAPRPATEPPGMTASAPMSQVAAEPASEPVARSGPPVPVVVPAAAAPEPPSPPTVLRGAGIKPH